MSPGGAFISASRMTCSFLLISACSVHVSLALSCSKRKNVKCIEMPFCFCSVMYCQDSCMPLLCFGDNARMVQFDPTWKELVKRLKEVCAGQKDLLQRHRISRRILCSLMLSRKTYPECCGMYGANSSHQVVRIQSTGFWLMTL